MSYYSRKLGGIGYAINYIRQKQEIRNNTANAKQEQEIQKKKDKAAQSETLDKTIGNSAFSLGGVSALPVINKLISIGKKLKNIKNTEGENENENAEEPQNEEGETYNDYEEPQDFEDIEDFETEIGPTPMSDAELEQFNDPFLRESENVRGNLRFGDTETSNMPDEADVSELPETEPEDLNFLQNTLSNTVFGKQAPKKIFKPSGSEGAGDSNVEGETGGNDVGIELNPNTLEPIGESKIETFDNIPEADDDFQNILNMANKTGSFAPEAEIVGGNTRNITGTVSIESIESAEPTEPLEPDGFETIDEDQLDFNDYGPSNLTEGGYDLQRFTRSGQDMANQQFGGDSTIARLGGGNQESPADGVEGLDDTESVFSPDRISSDIGNMGDVETEVDVGTETAEVGTETAEVGTDVGVIAGETALDTAAVSADVVAGATAAVPFVDIATAVVGAVLTTASIGVGIGLGVKNLIDSNAANKQVVSQPNNTQPNNILSYVGAESENYLNH